MKLIKNIYKFFDKKVIVPITRFFVGLGDKIKNIGKPLEVISKSKKGIIIISLILSVIVCYYIQGRSNSLLETNAKVLYDQPVTANYNEEEYVVEGLPKTVDITMIGNKANLYLANQLPTQTVVVDLSDLGVGSYDVDLKYKQAITSVQYKLDPSTVRVTISPKKSRTMNVTEEVMNLSDLNSELSVRSIQLYKLKTNEEDLGTKEQADDRITINEVIVKGKEETINQVATVKALVDVNKLTDPQVGENLLRGANEVPIVAYDSNGKKLDVELVPSTVRAVVNIESPSKEVPIVVVPKGIENIVFGKSIEKITQSSETVTLYGKQEALDNINNIEVEIDVTNLNGNKKFTETLKKPKNIRKLSVSTVNIDVSLGDESSKEISGVKLSARNLSNDYVVQVSNDSVNEIPVILKGVESVINGIKSTEIEAYVDLKDYQEGTHDVKVKVVGSDNRVIYVPKISTVKVVIIKK
jgi:YbbR domain-containing protein